ncbi:MAG TPA: S41 family peptidase [Ignavibacteriales bacterium]|nr:S41 family peptidase [Ignavibacteriales bacterium]
MKKTLAFILLNFSILYGQQFIPHDKLAQDFDSLVVLLEKTHPDPYMPFGGKMAFHKKALSSRSQIPESGMSKADFYFLLSGFVSKLHDGHTYIDYPIEHDKQEEKILPVKFTIAGDCLFIKEAQAGYEQYLGYRLQGVNGISINDFLEKIQFIEPCENIYGAYSSLRKTLFLKSLTQRLFPGIKNSIDCELLSPSGEKTSTVLTYAEDNKSIKWSSFPSQIKNVQNDSVLFAYQFLDDKKETAYFIFNAVNAREGFEYMKAYNMDYRNQLNNIYARYCPAQPKPINDDIAIANLPSLTETFWNMLTEMKKADSKYLIIDLRQNGGGMTPITIPTLYMLTGDKYFSYIPNIEYNTLISGLWLDKFRMTLEDLNKRNGSSYILGDYRFSYFMPQDTTIPVPERREDYLNSWAERKQSGTALLRQLGGKSLYSPKIVVLTSPLTFSAAFHYAYMLKNLCGAVIVGIPSRQAGNTGMETTVFKLKNSGISGSISNTYQLFFPADPTPGKTLQPDYLLNWNDYKKYHFDKQMEILYIMDLIKRGEI